MTRFDNLMLNLELLAEECAEIIHIKSKIVRFGLLDVHPDMQQTNLDRLHQEVGDLLTVLDLLVKQGVLDETKLERAAETKAEKLLAWEERYHKWTPTLT